jgi:TM2 domain-containing membrane protein YozV
MAEYHGDIVYRAGTIFESRDDNNYFIAIIFLLLFGWLGAHRFYLNDTRLGWTYFTPFAVSALAGAAMLDFTILIWEISIASFFLLCEFIYFLFKIVSR